MKKRNIILFIDDEKVCHTLAELIIPNFTDYKLIGAFSGNEAIELAKRYASDIALVLSDIMLPGINGYQVYSQLKEDERFANIPFIFQSGLGSQEEELKRHVISDVTILYKPYKQSDLLKAINDTLKSVN
ncbi:MAG: response regulator [Rickettsiaceae bacterium]|jgi:CheY-like chemotaxis protein|nr:response regulator [Rickettsiaceae bacterium]